MTHRRSDATNDALMRVLELCRQMLIEVLLPERELEKYPDAAGNGLATVVPTIEGEEVDLVIALGGDGTILRAFSHFDMIQTPILGINYGRVGFLSAINPEGIPERLKEILEGHYEVVHLSLLELRHGGRVHHAVNDIVVHKPDGGAVINLSYSVSGVEMDTLRCDGLVVSTAAGSTAYNLSAGGPLISLKLEAMAISAIAPHTLHSRSLVLSPSEDIEISNQSMGSTANIYIDGRQESELAYDDSVLVTLAARKASLVQLRGAEFHRKLRDKFIRAGEQHDEHR